jgi:quinohemoprotein ethanol dehydrogenase
VKEKDLGLKFWAAVAVSAIGMGVAIAFVAGFFLGHFTGHHHTTTVASGSSTAIESTTSEEMSEEGESVTASNGIALAPEFSSEELGANTGANWITNGGNLTNDRFSTLDEINTENVQELKGDWMTKIGKEATAAKFSAEGQALEYEGTIYISDGGDNVYAMDSGTGEILWTYKPHLPPDPLGEVICCGWDSRGVAIGDGMVYVSQLNGDQVALDQETGKVKWSTPVVKPGSGYSITSAPLYYNGRVYVGGSGGEYGVRGRLTALDAKTGKLDWRFYTVPSPQEIGGNTWPKGTDAYKHGGAAIWNTPTVDPKLNELYFSTSNASPGSAGQVRKGENLFTASIVALDAETGKYKWHYQEVHHDLWDFDAPSPTVLVDGEMEGKMQEAIAQPGKTGYLYILDRKTGKPIFPIPEKPVAQDSAEDTWPTQPMPTLPGFSPHVPTATVMKQLNEAEAAEKEPKKLLAKPFFYPISRDPSQVNITALNGVGGENWPPSSFDEEKDMYFTCSQSGAYGLILENHDPTYKAGATYSGAELGAFSGFDTEGILTAYNLKEGKIAWQKKFPGESCYSGAVTTAGGLLFNGHNNGELVAYDAETGEELWHFQTGAGANTTPTIFKEEGEEKIAFYAGGNSLAATPHGENFWVFSLTGTMEEEEGLEKEAEGTLHKGDAGKNEEAETETEPTESEEAEGGKEAEGGETAAAGAPDAMAGAEVFSENCSTCHGADGLGGNGGPDLTTMPKAKEQAGAEEQVTNGGGGMPAFGGTLSEEEIANVAAYVVEEIVGGK